LKRANAANLPRGSFPGKGLHEPACLNFRQSLVTERRSAGLRQKALDLLAMRRAGAAAEACAFDRGGR
jgi:hypothetical protein